MTMIMADIKFLPLSITQTHSICRRIGNWPYKVHLYLINNILYSKMGEQLNILKVAFLTIKLDKN